MSIQVVDRQWRVSNQKSRDFHVPNSGPCIVTDTPTPKRGRLVLTRLSQNAIAGDQPKARREQGIKEWMNLVSS